MTTRTILRQHPAVRGDIGDLVTRCPLPGPAIGHLDPFLFLNHHGPQVYPAHNHGLPFGPHPHRGFETVTFILSGELSHLDSGGHESIIHPGGVQWMTAGSGLVHAELSPRSFKEVGGPLEILQLWVNLPARLKMTQPRYVGLEAADIPVVDLDDAKVTVVSGDSHRTQGAFRPLTDIALPVIRIGGNGRVILPAPAGRTIFFYTVHGEVRIKGDIARQYHLIEFGSGETIHVAAGAPATILFGHAAPFGEPIVSHGPFVMNSRNEIVQAIHDYQSGMFGSL